MNCREVTKKINDLIEDTLTVREQKAILSHIRGCKNCFDELEVQLFVRAAEQAYGRKDLDNYDLSHAAEELIRHRENRMHLYAVLPVAILLVILVVILIAIWPVLPL